MSSLIFNSCKSSLAKGTVKIWENASSFLRHSFAERISDKKDKSASNVDTLSEVRSLLESMKIAYDSEIVGVERDLQQLEQHMARMRSLLLLISAMFVFVLGYVLVRKTFAS